MCYVGDACDVWREELVRARKLHRCDECFAPIPVGCRHVRIGSLFEGHWDTHRVHWECRILWGAVRQDLCKGKGLIVIGGLDEELSEYESDTAAWDDDDKPIETEAAPYRRRFEEIKAKYREAA